MIAGKEFVPKSKPHLTISNKGIVHLTESGMYIEIDAMSNSHLYNSIMKQIRKIRKVNNKNTKLARIVLAHHIKEFKKRGFNLTDIKQKLKTI